MTPGPMTTGPMTDRGRTVFPVGHYVGERHPGRRHLVRVGREHRRLTEDEFGVWVLAHGVPGSGRHGWRVGDVLDLAAATDVAAAEERLHALVGSGLLVTVGPEHGEALRFARHHRLDPLLVGIGNSAQDPDRYEVGHPGRPPVAVLDASGYELWQWGHVTPSLWHTHVVREQVAADLGERLPATALLAGLLADLRELLAHGCAYLDLARQ